MRATWRNATGWPQIRSRMTLRSHSAPRPFNDAVLASRLDSRVENANHLARLFRGDCKRLAAPDRLGDVAVIRVPVTANGRHGRFADASVDRGHAQHALLGGWLRGRVDVT